MTYTRRVTKMNISPGSQTLDFLGQRGLHTPWMFGGAAALPFPEATALAPVAWSLTAAALLIFRMRPNTDICKA